jgi:hypothetical protein
MKLFFFFTVCVEIFAIGCSDNMGSSIIYPEPTPDSSAIVFMPGIVLRTEKDSLDTLISTAADYFPVEVENKDTVVENKKQGHEAREKSTSQSVFNVDSIILDSSGNSGTSNFNQILPKKGPVDSESFNTAHANKQSRKRKPENVNANKNLQLFAGVELLRTTGIKDDKNSNLYGGGISLKLEKRIGRKFSGTLSYGLYHFPKDYTAINAFPVADTTTIQRFTLDILALGGRYIFARVFYLSAEGGLVFKSKVNERILFVLTSSAGCLFPLKKRHNKIDIGLKLYNTLDRVSLYGTSVLETGGYRIFSLRLAYGF